MYGNGKISNSWLLSFDRAIRSNATTFHGIIAEMLRSTTSERQGRVIDSDNGASMEAKKKAGYF